jgi:membrane fusion protein, heavy metal efflux system
MSAATILIVDDDEVLSQVLRRVLTREGYRVVEAGSVAQALELTREDKPQLGLLDLSLPDGDGMELAKKLRARGVDCPLILVTAYPLRLRDQPELSSAFTRVLTKPLNLQDLRQAIEAALVPAAVGSEASAMPAELAQAAVDPPRESDLPRPIAAAPPAGRSRFVVAAALIALACVLVVMILPALGMPGPLDWFNKAPPPAANAPEDKAASALPVKGDPNGVELGQEVKDRLAIQVAQVGPPKQGRQLTLSGSLNFDPNLLAQVHPRFSGEVIEIGPYVPPGASHPSDRPLSYGDPVREGQLLAVIWSKDLGEKKNDLIEGLAKLWTDQKSLKALEDLYSEGAGSEANVRLQKGVVAADFSAVDRARNALRIWRLTDKEIQEVEDDAKAIYNERTRALDAKGEKKTPPGGDWQKWARTEVRANFSGVIVERNVEKTGALVDVTATLFKIADLNKLVALAYAYEEDLPDLLRLPKPIPWQVRAATQVPEGVLTTGGVNLIGPIIDPNQHTALVMGYVDNPGPDHPLRAGQFITATITLPAPDNVAAVPASAVVETGSESIVFVQPDPKKPIYSMRRVAVAKRYPTEIEVLSKLLGTEGPSYQALYPGEWVVTEGAMLLKATLDDVHEREEAKKTPEKK